MVHSAHLGYPITEKNWEDKQDAKLFTIVQLNEMQYPDLAPSGSGIRKTEEKYS